MERLYYRIRLYKMSEWWNKTVLMRPHHLSGARGPFRDLDWLPTPQANAHNRQQLTDSVYQDA